MSQPALDFGRSSTPPRPRAARARTPLVGGRTPVARQASAEGAALNAPNREDQCARLLRYIEGRGMHGATDAEVERDLKWKVNVITARRNDLYADGLVVQRWPEPRRRSVTTNVPVIVTVASSVVRTTLPAIAAPSEIEIPLVGPSSADDREQIARPHSPRACRAVTDRGGQPGETGIEARRGMTAEQAEAVKTNTRVRLADGRMGQTRGMVHGLMCIYVFTRRAFVSLDASALADYRDVDGELRERAAST